MKIQFLIWLFCVTLWGQKVTVVSPELHSYPNLRDFCLSSDGTEAYFTIQSPNQELSQIVVVRHQNWKKPILLSFCNGYSYLEPFLSSDGKRLYFASNRPKTLTETAKSDYDIWYVERIDKNSSWSAPVNIGAPVNTENDEFYPTLADNGNLYFTMDAKSGLGKDDIYYCLWNGTAYDKPILLNPNINSEGYEFNAFIAKDERFLLFTKYNAKDGYGSGDLYFSRKNAQGEWQPAENLGLQINSTFMDYCPFYDERTQNLYFTSKRAALEPRKFNSLKEYRETIIGSHNGLSKIYAYKIVL